MRDLASAAPGLRLALLGNEAIARGALESGLQVATAYPGTPSTEIAECLDRWQHAAGFTFRYSANEKVALEIAAGAAIGGSRALVSMKHVGVNVAADAFNMLGTMEILGALVIVSADDPSMHSSQSEQDNRFFARLSLLPMLEPSDPQDALELTRLAFRLSADCQVPVVLRTTTRVNHTRGTCTLGEVVQNRLVGHLEKDPSRWAPAPAVARVLRRRQLERLGRIAAQMDVLGPSRLIPGMGTLGIVTAGVSYAYVRQALAALGREGRVHLLKLGAVHPLPEGLIRQLLAQCERVLVVEELEPYLETEIRALAQRAGIGTSIVGKLDGPVPRAYELSPDLLRPILAGLLGAAAPVHRSYPLPALPERKVAMCAGCPHRATFYAVKSVLPEETYFVGDIGCYTLGMQPPLRTIDAMFCMGSSVSQAQGARLAAPGQPIVAFVGDGTFFHGAMPGLANAVHHRDDLLLVILDNRTTAMTGHQPHPGAVEGDALVLDLQRVVRGLGVEHVRVVDPFDLAGTIAALREAVNLRGVRVVISRRACTLHARRLRLDPPAKMRYRVVAELCQRCSAGAPSCAGEPRPAVVRARARRRLARSRQNPAVPCGTMAPCTEACPVGVCVKGCLEEVREGRYAEALAQLRAHAPFTAVLAYVCHRPCEEACARAGRERAVAFRAVKRFLVDRETDAERAAWLEAVQRDRRPSETRVAVVGAGPAGLTAAYELARAGLHVTLFERAACPGGMLALGIPSARLPRDVLARELGVLLASGIELRSGETLGETITLRSLSEEFDAVCLAVGAWQSVALGIDGEMLDGVEDALSFLRSVNVAGRREVGKRVLVVGGGDAALDAARTARRLGAAHVEVLYRRSPEEMPAAAEEIEAALAEHIVFTHLAAPLRIVGRAGHVATMVCQRNRLGAPDASGRKRPEPITGSTFERAVDHVIVAVGQRVPEGLLAEDLPLERGRRGEVVVDGATGQTSIARIYAAGDVVSGPATVVEAVASGQRAARAIARALIGAASPNERCAPGGGSREVVEAPDADPASAAAIAARHEAELCDACGTCARCSNCTASFGCPAISVSGGEVRIDEALCTGCGVCAQLCPNGAIVPVPVVALAEDLNEERSRS